jgi:hypothetical protein
VSLFLSFQVNAQIGIPGISKTSTDFDSIAVEAGKLVLFPDTLFIPEQDTVFIVPGQVRVKIKENPYLQSEKFYDSLAQMADRSLVTRKLHELLFRSSAVELSDSIKLLRSEAPFEPYSGYRIADIRITTADFRGINIIDTSSVIMSAVGRVISTLHVDTKEKIIKNSLLFKSGDLVDPFELADNERLLRQFPYIRDARIVLVPVEEESTVDVYVITQDRLSLFVDGDFDGFDEFFLEVGTRSIMGTGNQVSVAYQFNGDESPQSGYQLQLQNFNIQDTFITGALTYSDIWDKKGYEISFERDFLTPRTRWAGGLDVGDLEQIRMEDIDLDSVFSEHDSVRVPYKNNFQDLWLGRSFILRNSKDRMNLTLASRVFRQKFSERPYVSADSNYFFHNEVFFLNEVVMTKRKYLKSTMIQTFGITEDIPVGYLFKFLGGYKFGEFNDQPYVGLEATAGRYWSGIGYISGQAGIGGFVEDTRLEQGVFSLKGLYFSQLLRVKRSHFRQFVNIKYSTAINPLIDDPFGLQGDLRGISSEVQGDRKFSVSSESVLFHALKFYGFSIASYAFYYFGWIGLGDSIVDRDN